MNDGFQILQQAMGDVRSIELSNATYELPDGVEKFHRKLKVTNGRGDFYIFDFFSDDPDGLMLRRGTKI